MSFWNFMNKKKEESASDQPVLLGVDLGYGQIKVLSFDIDDDRKFRFLSAVGQPVSDFGRVAAITSINELMDSLTITYHGKKYYVGHNAIVNSRNGRLTLRQNKASSEENVVKFITSLALFTNEDQETATFDIITGLPVLEYKNQKDDLFNMMYNGGEPFTFIMHYGYKQVKKEIKIRNIKILSQGEAAFYDYVLDNEGNIDNEKAAKVNGQLMVVDPGYRTTDIVTMENGRYIEPLSSQLNKGVNQCHQEILRLIMEKLNIKKELQDLDEIVRTGKLFYNMKEYDISSIIEEAAMPFAEDIIENLHVISNDQLGAMSRIIFCGGGSEIIYPYVSKLLEGKVQTSLMKNSEFCNASGYYKYGRLLKNTGNL